MSSYKVRPVAVGGLSRGAGYKINDLGKTQQGYTNLLSKELGVSLDASVPGVRWTHLHELAHVRHSLWSPTRIAEYMRKQGHKVSVDHVLAAEDARINERLIRAIPDAHEGYALGDDPLRMDNAGYLASHASPPITLVTIGAGIDADVRRRIDLALAKVNALPTRALTLHNVTMPLARLLEDLADAKAKGEDPSKVKDDVGKQEQEQQQGKQQSKQQQAGEQGDQNQDQGEDQSDNVEDSKDRDALGEPDKDAVACGGCRTDMRDNNTTWIIPEVIEPPLTVVAASHNTSVRSAETGSVLRWSRLYRVRTDGMVFRRVARKPGALQRGTVLIDVSGSMHPTIEGLDAIVKMLPHATIACYSGGGGNRAVLVILARNGRRVADFDSQWFLGFNGCDGPALLWLSRQQGPRLWYCDGKANGAHGGGSADLRAQCAAIMQAASITQVSGGFVADLYEDTLGPDAASTDMRPTKQMRVRTTCFDVDKLRAALKMIERGIY